jgi:excisionase family DNA binding protein
MSDKSEKKAYLTPGEVSDMLMVSPAAVRRWAADGDLKALTTPGGHRRFLPEDIEAFARQRNITLRAADSELLSVLIVDDDKQFSGYLMKLLSKYPEKIVPELANNGFEAGIKMHAFKPDVVLLDLMMPGLDGFHVCEKLKSDDTTKAIRVIAMTGYPSASNVEKILAAGAGACLAKPIDKKELFDLIGLKSSAVA